MRQKMRRPKSSRAATPSRISLHPGMAHRCLLASVLVALLVCGESYRAVLSTRLLTTSSRRPHCLTPLTLKSDDAADTSTKSESGLGMKLAEATGFSVETEGELTPAEDAALIDRINSEVLAESGVPLDQLINPSKVLTSPASDLAAQRALLPYPGSTSFSLPPGPRRW